MSSATGAQHTYDTEGKMVSVSYPSTSAGHVNAIKEPVEQVQVDGYGPKELGCLRRSGCGTGSD